MTIRAIVLACAGLPWCGPLAAQEPVRAAHFARVLGADGQPLAGVEVVFASGGEAAGAVGDDVVRAITDGKGRARAQLLPTRRYLAFAARRGDQGTVVSAPATVAGTASELVFAADDGVAPSTWRIDGGPAWREHGPLRVEIALAGCRSLVGAAAVGADGSVALPPLPAEQAEVRFFAGDRFVHATIATPREPFALPAPRRVAARAVDGQGRPLAGVVIERTLGLWRHGHSPLPLEPVGGRCVVATTGADGTAELLFAHDQDPFDGVGYPAVVFVAGKPGHASTVSGFTGAAFADGERVTKEAAKGVLTFTLPAEPARELAVRAAAGAAPRLRLVADQSMPYDGDSFTSVTDFALAVPDASGKLLVTRSPKGYELQAVQVPGVLPVLAADDPFRRAAVARTLVLAPAALGGPELDLRAVVPLRLQVLDAGAGPAVGAFVLCTPAHGDRFLDGAHAMQAVTDAAGRVVLPAVPGTWLLVAVHGGTWAKTVLEVQGAPEVQSLTLAPLEAMKVRVVDGDGKPIAGARFDSTGASWGGGGSAEDGFLCDFGYHVAQWALQEAVTDRDGHAAIPFLPSRWLKVDFVVRHDGRQSGEHALKADEQVVEIAVK